MSIVTRFFCMSMLIALPTLTGWAGGGHGGCHIPRGSTLIQESSAIYNQSPFYLVIDSLNGSLTTLNHSGVIAPGAPIPFAKNTNGFFHLNLKVYTSGTINDDDYVGSTVVYIGPDGAISNTNQGVKSFLSLISETAEVYGLSLANDYVEATGSPLILKNGTTNFTYFLSTNGGSSYDVVIPAGGSYTLSSQTSELTYDIVVCSFPEQRIYGDIGNTNGNTWKFGIGVANTITMKGVWSNGTGSGIATATVVYDSAQNSYIATFDQGTCFPNPYAGSATGLWMYDPKDKQPPLPSALTTYSEIPFRGFNLAGAEFEGAFQIPDLRCATYFAAKGANTIRLPFAWEYLQGTTSLGSDIDFVNNSRAKLYAYVVNKLTDDGWNVILDMHNYMRYNTASVPNGKNGKYIIGQNYGGPTTTMYAIAWASIAKHFATNSHVIFDLMNEPYNMETSLIINNYNAAIAAIRTAETSAGGSYHLILIEGNNYSGMHSWSTEKSSDGQTNAVAFAQGKIQDTASNYAINVHQYFDTDYSGTSTGSCISASTAEGFVSAFDSWLSTNVYRAIVTETGGAYNQVSCASCVTAFLSKLEECSSSNPDQQTSSGFIGWTGWAAGSFLYNGEGDLGLAPKYYYDSDNQIKYTDISTMTDGFLPHLTAP